MIGELVVAGGKIASPRSNYQPSVPVRDLTAEVRIDAQTGDEVLNRPYEEYNGLSFITRGDEDQKNWLAWMPPQSKDPEDSWRWYGTRPITRNKIISTAAHLTATLIRPAIFAQNEDDEEDREVAEVADTLLEYNIRHSNYEMAFLYGVISGLVNPVSYFEVNYCQAYQEILEGTEGAYHRRKVLDDELSGFQHALVPFSEVLFANPYEFNIQKQRFLMKRKRVAYHELEAKWSHHPNWQYIRPGVTTILNPEDNTFYDIDDTDDELCEELIVMSRHKDRQVTFINGIYFGDNNVDWNPLLHRTNKNKPKYNLVKYGAEPIDAMRFYGYKSLAAKLSNDQALADRMWNLAMDGSFLDTMEPIITIGAGKIDRSVMVPATVTDLAPNSQVVTGIRKGRTGAAFEALQATENSMSESSLDVQLQGQSSSPNKTARGAVLEQQNAETQLNMMARMIGLMAVEIGKLKLEDIIRYQTVGEVGEILGGIPKLKYRSFLVNQAKGGRNKTSIVKFTDQYQDMSEEGRREKSLGLYESAGDDKEIYLVNPILFTRFDFLLTFDYEQMLKRNTAFERAFKLEIYDRAIQNPYVDQEAITRDFLLEPYLKGNAAKYVKNMEEVVDSIVPMGNGQVSPEGETGVASPKAGLPSRLVEGRARTEATPYV